MSKKQLTERQKRHQKKIIMTILKILNVPATHLARWLDIDQSLISNWKYGRLRISPEMAVKMNKLCPEVSIEDICPSAFEEGRYGK